MKRSDDSFSISEFAEYINGEDGDGQQLVEYLRLKNGVNRPHRIFPEVLSDSDSISFNVQLEKIITPPSSVPAATEENQANTNNENEVINNENEVINNENEDINSPGIVPPTPSMRSPIRKSGGCSQSDRLRRFSFRRLSTLSYGRRMLLKEFESTLKESDFVPPVCSTPMTSKNNVSNEPEKQLQSNQDNETDISKPSSSNPSGSIPSLANISNSHKLMCCLHKQNENLENMLEADNNENSISNTNTNNNKCIMCSNAVSPQSRSLIRRTYTIEKGDRPGEVILTQSQKQNKDSIVENLTSNTISHKNLNESKDCVKPMPATCNQNVTTTKESEMVPLETTNGHENMVSDVQTTDNPIVPTPKTPTQEKENQLTNNIEKAEKSAEKKESLNINKNNLKITNVQKISIDFAKNITDDESEISDDNSTSTVPLNLAASKTKKANRSTKSMQPKVGTAYNLKLSRANADTRVNGRKLTLNKAPSTPINGEKFADEIKKHLARLTKNEILDLRTRNSLGQVFPHSVNKLTKQREALEKQHQLEEQIQLEIKKRSLQESQIDPKTCSVNKTGESSFSVRDELFSVPDAFRDNVEDQLENPLLQSDADFNLVTFIPPEKVVNLNRTRKRKKIDEQVQSYFDISKTIKTKNKSYTKRTLYSKDDLNQENLNAPSICEDSSSAYPVIHVVSPQRAKLRSSKSNITICSPPAETEEQPNSELLPTVISPPQLFSNSNDIEGENQITFSANTPAGSVTSVPDDEIFKKPLQPAPKKRTYNKNKLHHMPNTNSNSTLSNNNTLLNSDTDDPQAPRRSKRGHVPLKNSWSFRNKDPTPPLVVMLRQQIIKSENKKKERQFQALKNSSSYSIVNSDSNVPIASSTANSYINQKKVYKKNNRKQTKNKSEQELRSMLGDTNVTNSKYKSNDIRTPLSPVYEPICESLEDNTTNKHMQNPNQAESLSNIHAENKKSKKQNKEKATKSLASKYKESEISRLQLDAAPVNEINNLFDHLKMQSDKEKTSASKSVVQKGLNERTRKCCVRLKRTHLPTNDHAQSQNNLNVAKEKTSSTTDLKKVSNNFVEPNGELLSWLKGITNVQNSNLNDKMFKEMRCSAAGNLVFTDLEGIDYAFYDTEEKACLGYLRFKPHQIKPSKRAKKYHLHFIVLSGKFNIGTNEDQGVFSTGDMIAINIGSRYKIENITDDIGILIVIKK